MLTIAKSHFRNVTGTSQIQIEWNGVYKEFKYLYRSKDKTMQDSMVKMKKILLHERQFTRFLQVLDSFGTTFSASFSPSHVNLLLLQYKVESQVKCIFVLAISRSRSCWSRSPLRTWHTTWSGWSHLTGGSNGSNHSWLTTVAWAAGFVGNVRKPASQKELGLHGFGTMMPGIICDFKFWFL